jgi:hypothetical protein
LPQPQGLSPTLPEHITAADLETLNEGLRFFFSKLRLASGLFRQSESGEDHRHAAIAALDAAWRLVALFKQPYAELLFRPILDLQAALRNLDEGGVPLMLKPVRRAGRAPSTDTHAALWGYAAGTVQRFVESGISLNDAHKLVAEKLDKLGVRAEHGNKPITDRTVRTWCEKVAEDVGRHGAAATVYDTMFTEEERQRFSKLESDRARQGHALNSLADFVRAHYFEHCKRSVFQTQKTHLTPPFSCGPAMATSKHANSVPTRFTCHTRALQLFRSRIALPTLSPKSPH